MRIAYLAHAFPLPSEHYFSQEIKMLRLKNDVEVLIYAAFKPVNFCQLPDLKKLIDETEYLDRLRLRVLMRTVLVCISDCKKMKDIYCRVLFKGNEGIIQRAKGVLHTWMGVYLSELMKQQNIGHIHAHHGYLASWLAMVAAKMLGITYSMTLHGSDLLIDRVFLDKKIRDSSFCFTISEYNKRFILERYPFTDSDKVIVSRMGVDCGLEASIVPAKEKESGSIIILTVGRLAPVKNHRFLIEGCAELKRRGYRFLCLIIGGGKEKKYLARSIRKLGLELEVKILGHIEKDSLQSFYEMADLFVLTSKSEGLPIVIMEAMLNGTPVLAPLITGIPEIVSDGETGFLYESENLNAFVEKVIYIYEKRCSLDILRRQARDRILKHYDRVKNMEQFSDILIGRLTNLHHNEGDKCADSDYK